MPEVTKRVTEEECPVCGTVLVEIDWIFNPFPDDPGSLERQTSKGCSECGYQKATDHHVDYDPYLSEQQNAEREASFPKTFRREDFIPDAPEQ